MRLYVSRRRASSSTSRTVESLGIAAQLVYDGTVRMETSETKEKNGGDPNLDAVREILFVSQARDVDQRMAQLEASIAQQIASARDEMLKRITSLERFVKDEIASLDGRLTKEREERTAGVDKTDSSLRDLRTQLLALSSELRDEVTGSTDQVKAQ